MAPRREVTGQRRNGEVFPADVTLSRFTVDGEELLIACVRDVSDRRALEEQSTQAQKMEALGHLAAAVAHDFNNLLAAMQSNVYLLRAEAPEALRGYADAIGCAVERGEILTRQLLAFSRNQPTEPRVLEVNEFVASAEPLLRRVLPHDITLRLELAPACGWLLVDRRLMEQVLLNLASSARDAAPGKRDLVLRTGTELRGAPRAPCGHALTGGRYVRIELEAGSGARQGIDQALADGAFPGGEGKLGLSAARRIVRRAGGELEVRRAPDAEGAAFVVLLPMAEPDPDC
jgi:signal transduction histidine kinase